MTEHQHEWIPAKVGHVFIASNIPEYFVVRVICATDDCSVTILGVAEANDV